MFLSVQNDCFDEIVFDGFKAILSLIKNYQNCSKKSLRVTIGPKGGPLEKIFFETYFYKVKMTALMKENLFDGFKAI